MNWLSSAPIVLGCGVVPGRNDVRLRKLIGVRGVVGAQQCRCQPGSSSRRAEALRDALDDWDPYARDVAAAMLLSSGLARRAIARLEADDPIEREQAQSLIRKLVEVGKEEYSRLDGTLEIVQQPEVLLDGVEPSLVRPEAGPIVG
jgi:hypothetical protein